MSEILSVKEFKSLPKPRKAMTTTNSLTAAVIKYLSLKGFKVWRSNNLAAPGRKFTGLLGVPDVIGYEKATGRFIGVEIKTGKDSLSLAQVEFGINALEGGAMWFEVGNITYLWERIYWYEKRDKGAENFFAEELSDLKQRRNDLLIHKRKKRVA